MAASTTITECQNDGGDMKIYYDISGTCDTPVLVEHVGIIGDLNLGDVDDERQVQRRGVSGLKTYQPGDTEVSVTGQQIVDGNYEGYLALTKAKKGGVPGLFLILTGAVSEVNTVGYWGKWYNFDRSISGPSEDEQEATFNLKPAACSDCLVRAVKITTASQVDDWDQTALPA